MKYLFVILLITFLYSCKSDTKKVEALDKWYTVLKDEILKNSKQKDDSIFYETKNETLYLTYYLKGTKLRQEYRSLDTSQILVTKDYGKNDNFELRSEIHINGQKATEGITYKNDFFGPWTVWYDNGQIMYHGYRYKNENIGNWIYYSKKGEVQKMVDNKNLNLIDSILRNESLHTTTGLAAG